jgi:hypothetical protein
MDRAALREQIVGLECYCGYKADERPLRLKLQDDSREILAIEDRWYSPGATYFRVLAEGGDRYVLRHEEAQDVWSLSAFSREVRASLMTLTVCSPDIRLKQSDGVKGS